MDRSLQEHGVKDDAVLGFCFGCHHGLISSGTDVCSECGKWFDCEDGSTSYSRKPGFFLRIWLAPPGLAWFILTILMCALYLASESAPGGYFELGILCALCFTMLFFGFFGELFLHFIALWFCGRPFFFERFESSHRKPVFRRRELMWFMPPLLVLASILLVRLDVPFRLAFLLSEDALKSYVLAPPMNRSPLPGWIGLFAAESIDGTVITLKSGGMLQSTGLIYVDDVSEASYMASLYKNTGGSTWQINDEWIVFIDTL